MGTAPRSIGTHRSAAPERKYPPSAIIDTSAVGCPALTAASSCTSQASTVGSATDSIATPVAAVKSGKMFASNESLKNPP